jgi:hypothetical protein
MPLRKIFEAILTQVILLQFQHKPDQEDHYLWAQPVEVVLQHRQ